MNTIDAFLNKITMYRLVLYYLILLLGVAFCFSFFGVFAFTPFELLFSTSVILAVSWITNTAFARTLSAMTGSESVYITALILALIVTPVAPSNLSGLTFVVVASFLAMASKYILAVEKKHLFNPAALGVAVAAPLVGGAASWWVGGNMPLFAFVVLGGLLIVRKIKRFDLVTAFGVVALLTIVFTDGSSNIFVPIQQALFHSSIFFLAFVMLTEPFTTPPTRNMRIIYGALVGFFFAPNVHIGSFYMSPELALLVGNLFVYAVSPKGRVLLTLVGKKPIAKDTFEFSFTPDRPLAFQAGQYLEWTLPHKGSDDRGNRRYFTIASGPQEERVRLGVKFSKPGSTFKEALFNLGPRAQLSATQLAGDFVLPHDPKQKLAFIAGGIGITPFRSHIQEILDTGEQRSVVLLYAAKTAADLAYGDFFTRAERRMDLRTVYALSHEKGIPGTYSGFINHTLIEREIPDYRERLFYLSGPRGMVDTFTETLHLMGVPHRHIKTDYFPGFV